MDMKGPDWEEWRRVAFSFARHWGCSPADADDIAQQAVVAALQKGSDACTHAWFFVVTRRCAAQLRARVSRENTEESVVASGTSLPQDQFVLLSEIERNTPMTAGEHDLLHQLREGRSHAEIAMSFGWGKNSVGVRIQRFLRKLQTSACAPPLHKNRSPTASNQAGLRSGPSSKSEGRKLSEGAMKRMTVSGDGDHDRRRSFRGSVLPARRAGR